MPRGRKPDGERALSNAERQARHRARRVTQPAAAIARTRRSADRRSRPQRWRDAVVELLALQAEYAAWLDMLPDSLRDSATAEALEAIADLDLTALDETEPPEATGVTSSLSDLSKNRDFLEYYVLRSPGKIVKLRSDRYYF